MPANIESILETIKAIENEATTVLYLDMEHTHRLQNRLPPRKRKHRKYKATGIYGRAMPPIFGPHMVHWDGAVDNAEKLIEAHVSKYGWMF